MGEMHSQSDAQLLRTYAEHGSEPAFTELVQRHTNLVYSAALRQTGASDIAAEITQNVFISLARSAKNFVSHLTPDASLAGWLCRSARNLSLNHRRDEFRRITRERHAMEQILPQPDDAPDWEKLRRVLDDAMSELSETDYDALVLRFFQNQDLRAVGAAIGVSDDTAQKRVARALDKLRELLAQRGIRAPAATLGIVITANAVQAAPVGLAVTISAAALAGTATTTSTLIAATTKTIAMTTLQKTLVTATVAVLAGAGLYEARQAAQLRAQVQTLQQQQAPLAEQTLRLQSELDTTSNRVVGLAEELAIAKKNNSELLRLRGEVGMLKNQLAAQRKPPESASTDPMPNEKVMRILNPESLKDVGLSTPEQTLQTMLWAWRMTDNENSKETASQRLRELTIWPAKFDAQLVTWDSGETSQARQFDGVKFLQIDKVEMVTPEASRVVCSYHTDTGFKQRKTFLFKRVDDAWKLYIGPKFP